MLVLPTVAAPVLAQQAAQLQRRGQRAVEGALEYLTRDPTGRWVGGALVVLLAVLALLGFFGVCRWAIPRWRRFVAAAAVLVGGYFAVVYILNLGPTGWLVAGFVAFSLFLGFALFSTRGGSRR